jgi:hypothetical protein
LSPLSQFATERGRTMLRAPGVPQECWPCKSNPVRLGSSPRARRVLAAFGLSAGVLAAGPVQPAYSSEPPRRAEGGRRVAAMAGPHGEDPQVAHPVGDLAGFLEAVRMISAPNRPSPPRPRPPRPNAPVRVCLRRESAREHGSLTPKERLAKPKQRKKPHGAMVDPTTTSS